MGRKLPGDDADPTLEPEEIFPPTHVRIVGVSPLVTWDEGTRRDLSRLRELAGNFKLTVVETVSGLSDAPRRFAVNRTPLGDVRAWIFDHPGRTLEEVAAGAYENPDPTPAAVTAQNCRAAVALTRLKKDGSVLVLRGPDGRKIYWPARPVYGRPVPPVPKALRELPLNRHDKRLDTISGD